MNTKKWEDFLSEQELFESREHSHSPNGKYLVGKIVHDALHCLNPLSRLNKKMRFRAYLNRIRNPEISTHPHYKHTRDDVEPATPPDFGNILREIDKLLYSHLNEE